MSMISFPFDSNITTEYPYGDRAVNSETFRKQLSSYFTTGIFANPSTNFQVSWTSGMGISVAAGKGNIKGVYCYDDSATTFTLDNGDSLPRYDSIFLRLNDNSAERNVSIVKVKGTPASTPVAPELTRTDYIYDLRLANIYIPAQATAISGSRITDCRLNTDDCGVVQQTINTVSTTTIFNQYQDALDEYLDLVERAIDETEAGYLQSQITTLQTEVRPVSKGGTGGATYSTALANLHAAEATTANSTLSASSSINSVLNGLPKQINHDINIALMGYNYNEDVVISGFYGSGTLKIDEGAGTGVYTIKSIKIENTSIPVTISFSFSGEMNVTTAVPNDSAVIIADNAKLVTIEGVNIKAGSNATFGIQSRNGSTVLIKKSSTKTGSISANSGASIYAAVSAREAGLIKVMECTIPSNPRVANKFHADGGIAFSSTSFTGDATDGAAAVGNSGLVVTSNGTIITSSGTIQP